MKRKVEIRSEVDPYDLGKGPKREIFSLQPEPAHTEADMTAQLAEISASKSEATAKKEADSVKLAQARSVAGRIIKSENSVDWHKTPEPGPWSGRTVVENKKSEDVLIGAFPKTRSAVKLTFGQKLAAFFKRK